MTAKTKTPAPLSAKEELALLRKKYLASKAPASDTLTKSVSVPDVVGTTLDVVDAAVHEVKETFAGDNNIFTRINVVRVKRKAARGGYASA